MLCCPSAAFWDWERSSSSVPWSQLRYEPSKEGYVTSITEGQLSGAPDYDAQRSWEDADWRDNLDRYYGVDPDLTRTGGSI